MLEVTSLIHIPDWEIEFSFVRSSGPGGQNVNKVNSKAVLRWSVLKSQSLSDQARWLIRSKLASRLTQDGELVITSDRYRDQGRNREDCLEKLRELLLSALIQPKARRKTKPSRSSKERKLEKKKKNSQKKSLRRSPVRYD